jgi:hypothetical protein
MQRIPPVRTFDCAKGGGRSQTTRGQGNVKTRAANAAAEVAKKTGEEERENILIAYVTLTPG